MIKLDAHELVLIGILFVVLLLILRSLQKRSKSSASKFALDDLLLGEDGKASKAALVMFGSFVITSWVIVFQTLNKTLDSTTFGLYVGAWVVPAVARIIKPPPKSPDSTS